MTKKSLPKDRKLSGFELALIAIKFEKLEAENKKLREALELILEEEGPNCDGYETLIHATARRALEGTK